MSSTHTNTITLTDGREVFQSYGTTVAAFIPGRGYLRTDVVFSHTTQTHITKYLGRDRFTPKVDQAELLELTAPVASKK